MEEELGFLHTFDEAMRRTMGIVDMPDRKASLLIRMIQQNNGTVSGTKRQKFPELNDEEITAIEAAVRSCAAAVRKVDSGTPGEGS